VKTSNLCGTRLQPRRKQSEFKSALASGLSVQELPHRLFILCYRITVNGSDHVLEFARALLASRVLARIVAPAQLPIRLRPQKIYPFCEIHYQ
jgi:hypothetical protein